MHKFLFLSLLLFPFLAFSQNTNRISYEKAIEIALQNNFDIQLAKNTASQSALQNSYGAAGFLPKIDLNGSASMANNATRQEFSSGLVVDQNAVSSNSISAGAYLSWTIFDGMKMFATKEKLNLLEQQGELSFKIEIENTIEKVTLAYYQIVKQEQLIKGIQTSMMVTETRIKIAKLKSDVGSGSNVELLQAKLDLNAQKSNLISQKNLLNEYTHNLHLLLKSESNTGLKVDSSFTFEASKSMDEIKQKIEASNTSLLLARQNKSISSQSIREIRAQNLPKLGINSNYVFGRNENAAGFSLLNQNLGYNLGLSLSWNLFNGFVTKNQLKVAKIAYMSSLLQIEKASATLYSAGSIAYMDWLGNKEIVDLEEENIQLAKEHLNISLERMKLGLANYLEIKESENSFESALFRLVNARYNLKESETKLKKLCGAFLN